MTVIIPSICMVIGHGCTFLSTFPKSLTYSHDRMGTGAGRYIGQPLNSTNPLRRDTVLIPAYSYLVLRFVTDNRK